MCCALWQEIYSSAFLLEDESVKESDGLLLFMSVKFHSGLVRFSSDEKAEESCKRGDGKVWVWMRDVSI
jgi:hypothetical protein